MGEGFDDNFFYLETLEGYDSFHEAGGDIHLFELDSLVIPNNGNTEKKEGRVIVSEDPISGDITVETFLIELNV